MPLARIAPDIQAEVRQLHRHLGGKEPVAELIDDLEVVVADRFGFGAVPHLLAQLREDGAHPGGRELAARLERGGEVFPGHEAADRTAREGALPELLGEPRAARGSQEERSGECHGAEKIVAAPWAHQSPVGQPQRSIVSSFTTPTTPGALHATRSTADRSASEGTWPWSTTIPPCASIRTCWVCSSR